MENKFAEFQSDAARVLLFVKNLYESDIGGEEKETTTDLILDDVQSRAMSRRAIPTLGGNIRALIRKLFTTQ